MNDFTEAICQLDNVPRWVAFLSEREKAEYLFFQVLATSASVGIAEEDLYLLTCPAKLSFDRPHTRTRMHGRIVPYFERSRRERIMALLNRLVSPIWIQLLILATFSQLSLSDLQCHARQRLLAVSQPAHIHQHVAFGRGSFRCQTSTSGVRSRRRPCKSVCASL